VLATGLRSLIMLCFSFLFFSFRQILFRVQQAWERLTEQSLRGDISAVCSLDFLSFYLVSCFPDYVGCCDVLALAVL